ncbi:MAG: stage II sporulation protein M [Streptococcaceae bacterium]|jgi:uncharacterized membrane protein SpoIIM required for sporulation|nr:stage II sporulation protein M [Streptococcaceae bacterium]
MNSSEKKLRPWVKGFFYLSGSVFLSGIFLGSALGVSLSSLESHAIKTSFWELFTHNVKVCLFILIIGGVTGSIYSYFIIFINGFLIGKLLCFLYSIRELKQVISGLLPHFFFEVFGLMIFSTLSSLPLFIGYQMLRTENYQLSAKFFRVLFYGLLIGFVLIFIAALIEVKISKVNF